MTLQDLCYVATFFFPPPLTAAFAGPQFGVGFNWYRTSLTFETNAFSTPAFGVRSTVALSHHQKISKTLDDGTEQVHSRLLLREEPRRRRVLLDVLGLDGVQLDPLPHDVHDERSGSIRLERAGQGVRARDLEASVQERGPDECGRESTGGVRGGGRGASTRR